VEQLDPRAIEVLNQLVEALDANVVISSAWRCCHKMGDILQFLQERGFKYCDRILGKTRDLSRGPTFVSRGREIREWVETFKVQRFVILDDNDDMDELFPWLVRTDHLVGLQSKHIEEARAAFSRGNELPPPVVRVG